MRTMKPTKNSTAIEASVSPMRRLFRFCSGVIAQSTPCGSADDLGGRRIEASTPLAELRQRAIEQTAALPNRYRRLHAPARYPTGISAALLELKRREMAAR